MRTTTHFMKLNDVPFDAMARGEKTIELRLLDEKRRAVAIGDEIIFTRASGDERIRTRVVALHRFPSFAELYGSLPIERLGYSREEVKTASHTDMEIYYSAERQRELGVIGIEIELL